MSRYVALAPITTNTSVELAAIKWPRGRPQDGVATIEIMASGTWGGATLQITGEPNSGVAAIPITGATLTEDGSTLVSIGCDKYYAKVTGVTTTSITVYYRLAG